jgi:hypothetical protein
MRFPTHEPDIIRQALDVAKGLEDNKDVFPAPPTSPEDLRKAVADYATAHDQAVADAAKGMSSTAAKEAALQVAERLTKGLLRYGEDVARGDATKLSLLGWGPRHPRTPATLAVPGQVNTLQVVGEGVNQVSLGWQEPLDGGAVAAYRVQRRKRDGGVWIDVGMSVALKVTLAGQDAGVEWEYRVTAVNEAGDGPESNVVRAVL